MTRRTYLYKAALRRHLTLLWQLSSSLASEGLVGRAVDDQAPKSRVLRDCVHLPHFTDVYREHPRPVGSRLGLIRDRATRGKRPPSAWS